MEIQPEVKLLKDYVSNQAETQKKSSNDGLELSESFAKLLKNQLVETNDTQIDAQEMNKKLVLGEISNVHDVMIASQKATMALDFTLQLRTLLLNAYQSLSMLR